MRLSQKYFQFLEFLDNQDPDHNINVHHFLLNPQVMKTCGTISSNVLFSCSSSPVQENRHIFKLIQKVLPLKLLQDCLLKPKHKYGHPRSMLEMFQKFGFPIDLAAVLKYRMTATN